jgi:hypothetical protein
MPNRVVLHSICRIAGKQGVGESESHAIQGLPDLSPNRDEAYPVFCSIATHAPIKDGRMDAYAPEIEQLMKRLFDSLGEKDRRRYAAVEAMKLGHGGVEYVAQLLGCDPKTIRQGQSEFEGTDDLNSGRVRKKGAGGNG